MGRIFLLSLVFIFLILTSCNEGGPSFLTPTLTPASPSPSVSPTFPSAPFPTPTFEPSSPPFLAPIAQEYHAVKELTVNNIVWKVEKATFTRNPPIAYNLPAPKGKYLILEISTRSISWDARPPEWRQLVLRDDLKGVYYPVASHGLFLTLLNPQRIRTLIDPTAPPFISTAVFDVPEDSREYVLGIKKNVMQYKMKKYGLL